MSRHMLLSVCVRATLLQDKVRQRFIKGITAIAAASPLFAHADGSDLAGMVTSVATGGKTVSKGTLDIAQVVGVIFVVLAVIAARNRKENPQIKVSHIAGGVVFGVCLIAIPEIIKRSQAQIGLTPINVG